ncbi:MAG: DMT family transporter [Paracoccaceae bacterium]
MNDHLKGILITTVGVLLVIPDSLFVRLIVADPLVTSFWRGLTAGVIVLVLLLVFQGTAGFRAIVRTRWVGVAYIVLIGSTPPAFVLAISHTSVASAVFIFASMPVFAAVFSWFLLSERISRRMVITIAVVLCGLAIIAYGSGESQNAALKGDLWALYVSAAFALALTVARLAKDVSLVPAVPFAYFGSSLVLGFFVSPIPAFEAQPFLIMGHGLFIGAASCLLALGPRYISSAEVALLILLESVLAPVLVWYAIGEHPGRWALAGGAVVIGALIVSNLATLARKKAQNDKGRSKMERP